MIRVKDILRSKSHDIISITPETTVYEALVIMADKNIGAVVVVEGERLRVRPLTRSPVLDFASPRAGAWIVTGEGSERERW